MLKGVVRNPRKYHEQFLGSIKLSHKKKRTACCNNYGITCIFASRFFNM